VGTHFIDPGTGEYLGWVPEENAAPGPVHNVEAGVLALAGDRLPRGTPREAVGHDGAGGLVVAPDVAERKRRMVSHASPEAIVPLIDAMALILAEVSDGAQLSPEAAAVAARLRTEIVPLLDVRGAAALDRTVRTRERERVPRGEF